MPRELRLRDQHFPYLQVLEAKKQLPQELQVPSPKVQKPKASFLGSSSILCTSAFAFVLSSLASKFSDNKQTADKLAELLVAELSLKESLTCEAANGHINFYSSRVVDPSSVPAVTRDGCETAQSPSAALNLGQTGSGKVSLSISTQAAVAPCSSHAGQLCTLATTSCKICYVLLDDSRNAWHAQRLDIRELLLSDCRWLLCCPSGSQYTVLTASVPTGAQPSITQQASSAQDMEVENNPRQPSGGNATTVSTVFSLHSKFPE